MGAFGTVVETMAQMDVFQLFFPWLLVVSVTYGVLEKYGMFSEDASVNGTIALSTGFFAVGGAYYFLPQGIMTSFAAGLTFSLFGLLGFLILLAVAGVNVDEVMDKDELPAAGALIFFILSFLGAFVFQADVGSLLGNVENAFQDVVMPILVLIFLLLVVGATVDNG